MTRRGSSTKNFWIEVASAAVLALLGIAAFAYSYTRPLNAESLAIEVSDLRSFAAAGAQLSGERALGNLTETYFENEVEIVHEKVIATSDSLDSSTAEPSILEPLAEVQQLAHHLDESYALLAGDKNESETAGSRLEQIEASLKRIETKLKREADK